MFIHSLWIFIVESPRWTPHGLFFLTKKKFCQQKLMTRLWFVYVYSICYSSIELVRWIPFFNCLVWWLHLKSSFFCQCGFQSIIWSSSNPRDRNQKFCKCCIHKISHISLIGRCMGRIPNLFFKIILFRENTNILVFTCNLQLVPRDEWSKQVGTSCKSCFCI